MKNMKQALLVAGCLLATTTLFAQTEKGDWAQFGRYAEANKTVKVPSNVVFMGNSITDGWWPADSTFFIRNNFVRPWDQRTDNLGDASSFSPRRY